jgi:hypothetical protein
LLENLSVLKFVELNIYHILFFKVLFEIDSTLIALIDSDHHWLPITVRGFAQRGFQGSKVSKETQTSKQRDDF